MNTLKSVVVLGAFFTLPALADNYYVDSMMCTGPVVNKPSWMHPSYSNIVIKFTSFLSKRRDGSLVPSLRVANDYDQNAANLSKDPGGEVWFMPSLKINGDRVTGDDGTYDLTITQRRGSVDTLVGKYGRGSYHYALKCKAQVVKWPTRISDQTSKR